MTGTPETPAQIIIRAAKLIAERADAMEAEMATSVYWECPDPGECCTSADDRYRAGISNGLGGAAADTAGAWDLTTQRAVVAWLEDAAKAYGTDVYAWPGHSLKVACAYLGEPVPATPGWAHP